MVFSNSNCTSWLDTNLTDTLPLRFQDFKLPRVLAICSYCAIVVGILSLVADIRVLLAFRRNRRLINPFTIHILNLIVIEVLFLCFFGPVFLLRYLHRDLFHRLPYCNVYKFFGWTLAVMQLLQCCVICGDRWLAFLAPLWYRREKTVTKGVVMTLFALVYQQAWFLPIFVAESDNSLHRMKGAFCDYYVAWPVYWGLVQIFTYFVPFLFLFASYPVLIVKASKRNSREIGGVRTTRYKTAAERVGRVEPVEPVEPVGVGHDRRVGDVGHNDGVRSAIRSTAEFSRHSNARYHVDTPLQTGLVNVSFVTVQQRVRHRRRRRSVSLVIWLMMVQLVWAIPSVVFFALRIGRVTVSYMDDMIELTRLFNVLIYLLEPLICLKFLSSFQTVS